MDRKESRGEISPKQLWYRAHKSQYTLVSVKQNNCFFSHQQCAVVLWLKAGRAPIFPGLLEKVKRTRPRLPAPIVWTSKTLLGQSNPSSAGASLNPFQGGSNWSSHSLVMDLLEVIQSFVSGDQGWDPISKSRVIFTKLVRFIWTSFTIFSCPRIPTSQDLLLHIKMGLWSTKTF